MHRLAIGPLGRLSAVAAATLLAAAVALAAAIAGGGPAAIAPREGADPYAAVDFSDLPPVARFAARDGTALAYRAYERGAADRRGSIVLLHGSSSRSDRFHPLARGFAAAGYAVYALDMRGHGDSGVKGQIAYIGQLEDDLEDFMRAVQPTGCRTLVAFSAGGGFALRFAADGRGELFDNFLLLAPVLGRNASTQRPSGGGWGSIGMPRTVALVLLNGVGITALNGLPTIRFALRPQYQERLTPQYSFALMMNFAPHLDYQADIAAARRPLEIVVGETDEQFDPTRYGPEFRAAGREVPVTIVPGVVSHLDLTLNPAAIAAALAAVGRLDAAAAPASVL